MKLLKAYDIVSANKDTIIDRWILSESLYDVLKNIKYDQQLYKNEVAAPILEYFLNIITEKAEVGDCPTMRTLVETFLDSGLCVEDVFLNCTTLKNLLVETLYDNNVSKNEINETISILDKNLKRILGIYTKEKNEKDRKSNFHLKLIEEHVALTITDSNGVIIYVTDAFCKLSGYSEDELLGSSHRIIRHPDMPSNVFKSLWNSIKKNNAWKGVVKNKKKDGGEFIAKTEIIPYINDENVVEYVAIRHDITDKEISHTDTLTGFYNRRYYEKNISKILKKHRTLSLMMIDIDHFKQVNDKFGHTFGDFVLAEFSKIVSKNLREHDICIRWGGEEFIIILPNTKQETAEEIAERIRKSVKEKELKDPKSDISMLIKCSIGVTEQKDNDSKTTIFDRADANLYEAKSSGRDMVVSK
jgi:diguanylate cyclase (GGDEF)-like protein/PAS domain S-box-containing protein